MRFEFVGSKLEDVTFTLLTIAWFVGMSPLILVIVIWIKLVAPILIRLGLMEPTVKPRKYYPGEFTIPGEPPFHS